MFHQSTLRRACLSCTLFFVLLGQFSAQVQSPEPAGKTPAPSDAEKLALAHRQSAMGMLDEVLAGTNTLALPQNRLVIEAQAFPVIWPRNESRARALVNQMAGEFAQAAGQRDENTSLDLDQMLRQERVLLVQAIAQSDPELALHFLTTTRPYLPNESAEQDDSEDQSLRLDLATRIALHNPARAEQMAEKELQASGDIPSELLNLLNQVQQNDPEAGTQLFRDIVARVKNADLVSGQGDFNFAIGLLNNQFSRNSETGTSDDALRALAEAIASAALNPQFPDGQSGQISNALSAFDQLAPGRARALRQLVRKSMNNVQQEPNNIWADFNLAQANGDTAKIMSLITQAPDIFRSNMIQQAAANYASNGDLQNAHDLADRIPDPAQRSGILQLANRNAALKAAGRNDFATALQLSAQVTVDLDRSTLLAELGQKALQAKQPRLAEVMLDEASSLLVNHPPCSAAFAAQLQLARAYLVIDPARAMPLLERSASQLQQVLAAAEQVDAFLPYQPSFNGSELILRNSFLFNTLIQPYALAAAELANIDLNAARTLADRLPFPAARLMTKLFVARSALGDPNSPVPIPGFTRWGGEFIATVQ